MTAHYCKLDENEKTIFCEWMGSNESWLFQKINNMEQLMTLIDKFIIEEGIAKLAIDLISDDLKQRIIDNCKSYDDLWDYEDAELEDQFGFMQVDLLNVLEKHLTFDELIDELKYQIEINQ